MDSNWTQFLSLFIVENLHLVFCVITRFLTFPWVDIYMVGCCAEVVVGRMQLEGCAIEGYGFQGADLALVITYHVVIQ